MKANELRIGNIIEINGDIVEVTGVMEHGIYFGKHGYIVNLLDFIKPIPLTDEILRDWCWFNKALRVEDGLTKHGIDLVAAGDAYYDNRTGREITTLHQLQNYVYAVSGNELEVKLPTRHSQAKRG